MVSLYRDLVNLNRLKNQVQKSAGNVEDFSAGKKFIMPVKRPCSGSLTEFRRRSHELAPPPQASRKLLYLRSHHAKHRTSPFEDAWHGNELSECKCGSSMSPATTKTSHCCSFHECLKRNVNHNTLKHKPTGSRRKMRRQESVTYEESMPVIMRRRGCMMTVRIVSVEDVEDYEAWTEKREVPFFKEGKRRVSTYFLRLCA